MTIGKVRNLFGALRSQLPLVGVLVFVLFLWSHTIADKVSIQVEDSRTAVEHDLKGLAAFASSQSAAFASTSFIGYSIGRYYGFAPAFAQISPDPERASALLRSTYGQGKGQPTDLPPALAAYDAVHERFHNSFVGLIGSTVFDDLFLADRFGRVLYTLRKDRSFGMDLSDQKNRGSPLAELYREVMARVPKADDPQDVLVITPPRRFDDGAAILFGRPIVRHGSVEGMVAFRMPLATVEQRFRALERPGLRFQMLDDDGQPLMGEAGPSAESEGPLVTPGTTGWQVRLMVDRGRLAGWAPWTWWVSLAASLAALFWPLAAGWRKPARTAPAMPPSSPASVPVSAPPPVMAPVAAVEDAHPEENGEAADAVADATVIDPASDLDGDETFRRSIVEVMSAALDYWQKARRKGKIELAEESGLWRVYMDRSSLQTRTLDKYLLVETLPRNPRWRDVVRTAEYVLRHCPEPMGERESLTAALTELKQQLRRAGRI